MLVTSVLDVAAPASLVRARALAHRAVQLPALAARANLAARPDDSHTSLNWHPDSAALWSEPLACAQGHVRLGLRPADLALLLSHGNGDVSEHLLAGRTWKLVLAWLDSELGALGLERASTAVVPYELPAETAEIETFETFGMETGLEALSHWFAFADDRLHHLAEEFSDLEPGPGPVRCWPHHFDIASYIRLEDGDRDSARGIGVGLSPGDASCAVPYFYMTPWPRLSPARLPVPPVPGYWHTEGFVGLIAPADKILGLGSREDGTLAFLVDAVASGHRLLMET